MLNGHSPLLGRVTATVRSHVAPYLGGPLPRPLRGTAFEKALHVLVDVDPALSERRRQHLDRGLAVRPAEVEVLEERDVDRVHHRVVAVRDHAIGDPEAGGDDAHVASIDRGLRVVAERPSLNALEAGVLLELGAKVGIRSGHQLDESGRVDRRSPRHVDEPRHCPPSL